MLQPQLLRWPLRRWLVAAAAAVATVLVVAVPTAMITNPVFGREIPTEPWAWPVLLITALLGGLVAATYVGSPAPQAERPARAGLVGGFLTFFAVGCPVCNKLVLLALGSAGAMQWFAPVQPFLGAAAIAVLGLALVARLRGERACPTRAPSVHT